MRPNSTRDPLDVLADEFVGRYRAGERPSVDEYVQRHPELGERIRRAFPALVVLEDLAPDPESSQACQNDSWRMDQSLDRIRELGDFRIIWEVGRGGMGVVYEAEQLSLGRRVALKVLPRQLLAGQKQRKRFEREAKAAARLHHTNIVPVFGVGHQDGLHYYVMQFIHGLGLDDVIAELQRARDAVSAERCAAEVATPGENAAFAPRSGQRRDVSAIAVARCLLTGEFDRTVVFDEGSDGREATQSPSDDRPGAKGADFAVKDTAVGRHSETVDERRRDDVSRKIPTELIESNRKFYWRSVARIGIQAAEALQYAHDQGIIHRDIKPANLLLDTAGVIWVTDFGLAKAADQQDLTHTGDVLGTLRYMAPEQFDGASDARSDVYALGLTLYELLALRPAYDERERSRLIKQVTSGTPQRLRSIDLRLPRDLETIVHKAIERDPAHRYQTADELRADLQHYLSDEPIKARRASVVTRLRRWCWRNPMGAAVVLLLLLLAIGGPLAAANQARLRQKASIAAAEAQKQRAEAERQGGAAVRHRQEAERQRARAEENLRQAREAVDQLFTKVAQDLAGEPHMEQIRRELLEDALKFYQGFMRQEGEDPGIRADAAMAYLRVSEIEEILGRPKQGVEPARRAVELFEKLVSQAPDDVGRQAQLAEACHRLGLVLFFAKRPEDAAPITRRSLKIWDDLAARSPTVVGYRRSQGRLRVDLANQLNAFGEFAEAEAQCRESLSLWESFRRDFPDLRMQAFEEAHTHHWLASTLIKMGRHDEAENHLRKTVELRTKLVTRNPRDQHMQALLGHAEIYLGQSLQRRGALDEAEQCLRAAADRLKPVSDDFPAVSEYRSHLGMAYLYLSQVLFLQRRFQEAEQMHRRVMTTLEDDPENPAATTSLGWAHYNLGLLVYHQRRIPEAADSFREAFQRFERADQQSAGNARVHARTQNALRWTLLTCPLAQFRDPERALQITLKLLQSQPLSGDYWISAGIAYYRLRRWDEAIEAFQKSREPPLTGGGDPNRLLFLAMAYAQRGDKEEGRRWYEQAVQAMELNPFSNNSDTLNFRQEADKLFGNEAQAPAPPPKASEAPDATPAPATKDGTEDQPP